MWKTFEKVVLATAVVLLSAGGSTAIQLLGDTAGLAAAGAKPQAEVQQREAAGTAAADGEIWVPGLGVVGKMPSIDFGLDMLYGQNAAAAEETPERADSEALDPDFAIRGTIKKKF
jgi:hypothetical protein